MRIITNERRVRRGRFLATATSIAGLMMMMSSWVAVFAFKGIGVASIPLLLIGVIFSMIGIQLSRRWIRLPVAHEALSAALKGTGKDAVLLNHWSPVDHILLTPQGIFTLTSRNQPISLTINGEKWVDHSGVMERLRRGIMLDALASPLDEARHDAEKAKDWLSKVLEKTVDVHPVIVFLSPKTELEVKEQSDIPVAYIDKRKKPNLKSFLRSGQSNELTLREIDQIAAIFESR